MKTIKRNTLILGTLFLTSVSFSQKLNETSAATEYKSFTKAYLKGDFTVASSKITKAKEFIDLASEHSDTKNNPKTIYYKGLIYGGLFDLEIDKNAQNAIAFESISNENLKKIIELNGEFKDDSRAVINGRSTLYFDQGLSKYNGSIFDQATVLFFKAYSTKQFIGENFEDASKNGIISLGQANNEFDKLKDVASAVKLTDFVLTILPTSISVLCTRIDLAYKSNDNEAATLYINKALSIDPTNKILHYNLGTSYMNQNKFQEAESHFLKSLENDPSYTNALYQSGANYFAWANEIIKTANLLPFNDPKFPKMDAEAKEIQKKALIPLEKYIDTDPNDKNILDILYKTHRKLGNTEKASSYKARYDALK